MGCVWLKRLDLEHYSISLHYEVCMICLRGSEKTTTELKYLWLLVMQIVSKDLSDPVRSHKDLDKDAAPFFKKAVKFYEGLAKQLVSQGHVLDLFASALDQVRFGHFELYCTSLYMCHCNFKPSIYNG